MSVEPSSRFRATPRANNVRRFIHVLVFHFIVVSWRVSFVSLLWIASEILPFAKRNPRLVKPATALRWLDRCCIRGVIRFILRHNTKWGRGHCLWESSRWNARAVRLKGRETPSVRIYMLCSSLRLILMLRILVSLRLLFFFHLLVGFCYFNSFIYWFTSFGIFLRCAS